MPNETLALHGGSPVRGRPFSGWPVHDDGERAALVRVLDSGNWGGYPSPNVEADLFAKEFARHHDAPYGVCAANGTVTLLLALRAGGVTRGDEVIVPPLTFMATAAAAVYAGAVPVFADVRPTDYTLDPDTVEAAITHRTRAVVCVHLGASVCDLDRLTALCRRHGLLLIEDCAHVHGARWRERGIGSHGDFGSFSFQSSKLMTAGEGGIVLARGAEHGKRVHSLVNCGRREAHYADLGEPMLGYNFRITELQAALLRVQLSRLDAQNQARAAGFAYVASRLAEVPGVRNLAVDPRVTRRAGYQWGFDLHPEAFAGRTKARLVEALRAEGIPAHEGYQPLHARHELFPTGTFAPHWYGSDVLLPDYDGVRCRVAELSAARTVWLPHQVFLGPPADLDDIVEAVARVQRHAATV